MYGNGYRTGVAIILKSGSRIHPGPHQVLHVSDAVEVGITEPNNPDLPGEAVVIPMIVLWILDLGSCTLDHSSCKNIVMMSVVRIQVL